MSSVIPFNSQLPINMGEMTQAKEDHLGGQDPHRQMGSYLLQPSAGAGANIPANFWMLSDGNSAESLWRLPIIPSLNNQDGTASGSGGLRLTNLAGGPLTLLPGKPLALGPTDGGTIINQAHLNIYAAQNPPQGALPDTGVS